MTPTQRSLKILRDNGYRAHIVEKYNMFARRRIDLFGFGDILAIKDGIPGSTAIQTTSGSNVSAHIHKIFDDPEIYKALMTWLNCGNQFVIHGWAKRGARGKRKTWDLRNIVVTPQKLESRCYEEVVDDTTGKD